MQNVALTVTNKKKKRQAANFYHAGKLCKGAAILVSVATLTSQCKQKLFLTNYMTWRRLLYIANSRQFVFPLYKPDDRKRAI